MRVFFTGPTGPVASRLLERLANGNGTLVICKIIGRGLPPSIKVNVEDMINPEQKIKRERQPRMNGQILVTPGFIAANFHGTPEVLDVLVRDPEACRSRGRLFSESHNASPLSH
jgi:hypothetical protein